jgi:beta-galactosidase
MNRLLDGRATSQYANRLPACLQIENEYGFCGSSKPYLRHLAATARQHLGNDTILYTTDPPAIAPKGSIYGEEVYTCVHTLTTTCPTLRLIF